LVTADALSLLFFVMADRTALFVSDKFAVRTDIGVADGAVDLFFEEVVFVGECHAEYRCVDLLDPGMAVQALRGNGFGNLRQTCGFVTRSDKLQRFCYRIVCGLKQLLGKGQTPCP